MGFQVPAQTGDEDVLHLAATSGPLSGADPAALLALVPPTADQTTSTAAVGRRELSRARALSPARPFILEHHYGLALRAVAADRAESWQNELVSSYRLDNGVPAQPINDRRYDPGRVSRAEGGLPIPADKTRRRLRTYLRLLQRRCASAQLTRLPSRTTGRRPWRPWCRCCCAARLPGGPKVAAESAMEVRLLRLPRAGANWTSWRALGNAGDPYRRATTAALDVDGAGPATGLLILAPHLTRLRKRTLACRT